MEVELLQYHHGVPEVPIPEVHPHGGPRHHLSTTPLNWEVPWPHLFWKHHPVSLGLIAPSFPFYLLSWYLICNAVLGFSVRIQWLLSQVLPVLRASDPLPLSLLLAPPWPHHPTGYRLRLTLPRPPGMDGIQYPLFCGQPIQLQPVK